MQVTKTRVQIMDPPMGKILAFADVLLDDVLEISHVKVVEGRNGPFVSMPSWRSDEGKWSDFVIPHDDTLRTDIINSVMDCYHEETKP